MKTTSFKLETIAIGDELLTGKIADTNSAWVASQLFRRGFALSHQTVIADDVKKIQQTISERSNFADVVFCFGGLGPTSDDKTAECIADLLGCKLVEHLPSKERMTKFLLERNRQITPQILKQIIYPEKTEPIFNPKGLAVGFSFVKNDCEFYFLPGVPHEMKAMFEESVLEKVIIQGSKGEKLFHHLWKCLDIPESELQRLMDPIEAELPKFAYLGYRTKFPENHLTLYMRANETPPEFSKYISRISELVRPYVYTEEDLSLEEIVLQKLKAQGKSLVFAESCSGGMACERMTSLSGASQHVFGSFTVYQTRAKEVMLGLKVSDLESVSKECSLQLALRAKKLSGADIAASITGYLGPTGGTEADPVGTMYLCVVGEKTIERRIFQPWKERSQAQWGAATHLLNLVRSTL